jgi:hypothetical protein
MKGAVALTLTLLLAGDPADAEPVDGRLTTYVADYDVKYGSLKVGTSRTELSRFQRTDQWVMETRLTANALGRLFAGGSIVQHSSFQFDVAGLRPLRYRFDDGTRRTDRDVALQFDWLAGRVTGLAEGSTVDIPVISGLQDSASAQAFVQLRLLDGVEPGIVPVIEKNRIKYYQYTLLRRERLETAIGVLDTVVYRSAREGSTRENVFWLAPRLGYAIVQAEQRRDGERQFQTYISAFRSGS